MRKRNGFTLVELLILIAIIGILLALIIPAIGAAYKAMNGGGQEPTQVQVEQGYVADSPDVGNFSLPNFKASTDQSIEGFCVERQKQD